MSSEIRRFDEPITGLRLQAAHNAFDNEMIAEEDPTLGTRRLGDTAALLAHPRADHEVTRWFAMDRDEVVAAAVLFNDIEDAANTHLGWFELGVLPERRRAGLGTRLLREVAVRATESGRSLLMTETRSDVPAGGAFMARHGAQAGLVEAISQVLIADIEPGLMDAWIARGRAQSDRFELYWLDGRWPEDMLDEVVRLSHVMNDAPFGDLDFNDQAFTVGHIVAEQDDIFGRGFARHIAAIRERASGRLVGYTAVYINPSFPDLGQQGDTGVFPEFRGNGLGKWIKAEMVRHLTERHPEVARIRTGNANSNAPMLAINHAMGFTLHHDTTVWQVEVERLL